MKIRNLVALLLALLMGLSLAACETEPSVQTTETTAAPTTTAVVTTAPVVIEPYEFKVRIWVPEALLELTEQQITDFNLTNTQNLKVVAELQAQPETDVAAQILENPAAAPDLYLFAQDRLPALVRGAALAELPGETAAAVKAENSAGVVNAGMHGSKLYAYPICIDDGTVLYYDKSVIPEADLTSLEKLIEDCEDADQKLAFAVRKEAWYGATFFFATGCRSNWTVEDGKTLSYEDNFNSHKGLVAVKGMQKLLRSDACRSTAHPDAFRNGAAVVVSGPWAYDDMAQILEDDLGVAALPAFTVDEVEYHLGSFCRCKLLGVKPQQDAERQAALHCLAQYLSDEQAQRERFKALNWPPANFKAAADPAVQADPLLAALTAQSQYAVALRQMDDAWWSILAELSTEVEEADSEDELREILQTYADELKELCPASEEDPQTSQTPEA